MDQSQIRNFCIIAHVDHGKSTLADRLLEMTGTVKHRDMQEQLLDSNPIERERGITIKLAPVRMVYKSKITNQNVKQGNDFDIKISDLRFSNSEYILNLIDTPGHVDFNYEVSRSLQACEGAILVVDATQGVQAQTLANLNLARQQNLTIIPVVNKIDLPNAQTSRVTQQLIDLGFNEADIISISAKTGTNVEQVLVDIVKKIPPPNGGHNDPLRALVFSSQYDIHKGVVVYVRIVDGKIGNGSNKIGYDKFFCSPMRSGSTSSYPSSHSPSLVKNEKNLPLPSFTKNALARATRLRFIASGAETEPIEIGYFSPKMVASDGLLTGEVGYIATGLKDVGMARVGDTITVAQNEKRAVILGSIATPESERGTDPGQARMTITPLPGYKEPKPMVFLDLYPIQSEEINTVRDAMGKLRLSDSAFSYRPIHSLALGNGFHCGFLGLLHAEVVQERLSREFGLSILATPPTVEYQITKVGKVDKSRARKKVEQVDPSSDGSRAPVGAVDQGDQTSSSTSSTFTTSGIARSTFSVQSAVDFPDPSQIEETREPVMEVKIYSPRQYVGSVMQLCQDKRGEFIDMKYTTISTVIPAKAGIYSNRSPIEVGDDQVQPDMVLVIYLMPLSEMIIDFFDRLKSITEGYASLDYEFFDYQVVELVKLDILLNHEKVDAFSQLVVSERAPYLGRLVVEKLAEVIPRHQFAVPIQAAIGGTVIARADVKAFRKDVTQKLYGGDRTRKDKLLETQKKGKKKMKMVGRVEIPQEAFLKVFKQN